MIYVSIWNEKIPLGLMLNSQLSALSTDRIENLSNSQQQSFPKAFGLGNQNEIFPHRNLRPVFQ